MNHCIMILLYADLVYIKNNRFGNIKQIDQLNILGTRRKNYCTPVTDLYVLHVMERSL